MGKMIVISGASGVGKGTVLNLMMQARQDLTFSVSATTRAPRPGESEGVHYYFITKEHFREMLAQDAFVEHSAHMDNLYGTPKGQLEEKLGMMVQTIRSREAAGNNQGGVLDISFELYPSAVGFQPFDLKEEDADCAMQDTNESWWLLTADGQVVKKTSASLAKEKLLLEGTCSSGSRS